MVEFCRSEIKPAFDTFEMTSAFENLEGESLKKPQEEFIKKNICKANFGEFSQEFKKNKVDEGERAWADVFSTLKSLTSMSLASLRVNEGL